MAKDAEEVKKAKPKVLFIIADVAAGHRSGAEAMAKAIQEKYDGKYETKVIDLFKLADVQPFNGLDLVHSLATVNRTVERLQDFGYRLSTEIKFTFDIYYQYMRFFMLKEAKKIIDAEDPDVVVSVHPFCSMVLRMIKENHPDVKYKTVSVVTDLVTIYRGWGDFRADLVISPTAKATNMLTKWGVPIEKIAYPLFPIKPELKNFRPREEVMAELGFSTRKHTILLTGGGFGLKSMMRALQDLARDVDLQLIVITGKLPFLQEQLEMKFKNFERIKIFGYVNNFQDYMNAADLVVTKPGPATVLESELFEKKAVLTRHVGYQEVGNIWYALHNKNFRHIHTNWGELKKTIYDLLEQEKSESEKLSRRKFDESFTIAEKIVALIAH
jgi:UDP-N-acetylglucosamine:LPS N-acetylglucosamine transferase